MGDIYFSVAPGSSGSGILREAHMSKDSNQSKGEWVGWPIMASGYCGNHFSSATELGIGDFVQPQVGEREFLLEAMAL